MLLWRVQGFSFVAPLGWENIILRMGSWCGLMVPVAAFYTITSAYVPHEVHRLSSQQACEVPFSGRRYRRWPPERRLRDRPNILRRLMWAYASILALRWVY